MMRRLHLFALLLPLLLAAMPSAAVEPDEILEDPALEARARALSAEVRCLVCQNESIDSSNAELARELRLLIRERLVAGDDEPAIKAFLVSRYGDFVLLKPPVKLETALLWIGPFLFLLAGLVAVVIFFRRQSRAFARQEAAKLSGEEAARLDRLLEDGEETAGPGRDDTGAGPR